MAEQRLTLHGVVGDDFTSASVAAALRAAGSAPITVSLHSFGGDALAGIAMHNMLARHPGRKTVVVEGVAASAASLIAMAGDDIVMPENAFLMLHHAWGGAVGRADDLRGYAEVLDQISTAYRDTYARRTGRTPDEVLAMMDAETWLTAPEAVAAGFATRTAPPAELRAVAAARAGEFRNLPADARRFLSLPTIPTTKDTTMTDTPAATAAPPAPAATLAELRDIAAAARGRLGADWVLAQAEAGATLDAAREAAIAALANDHQRRPVVTVIRDERETFQALATEALAARVTGRPVTGGAREYRGMSMVGLAREALNMAGRGLPASAPPATVIGASLTTDDFPLLLKGTMQRILQDRLEAAPGAARLICRQREVPDFREGRFLQFAGVKDLHLLNEGGEIRHAPPAERGEPYAVKTWARQVRFTRQALVNDELAALEQMSLFANAVVATEAGEFVKMFATNGAGWGPTLADGNPLWHASHGNVGSGAVGTSGISAGRVVMRAQTDASGNLVAPAPRIMLVGPENETLAEQTLNATAIATSETGRPVFANRIELAVEPRLSGAPWFLFASPTEAPVLALVTLEGSAGVPVISEHQGPDFDGLAWKITHDFVIAPMGFVGGVRMSGT